MDSSSSAAETDPSEFSTHGCRGTGSRALRVRCPQCHNPVEIGDDAPLSEILCSTCDSSFSLLQDTYATPTVQNIGHFELLERLGTGGFGTVWKARDTRLDRTVALKIPRHGRLASAELEQAFFREARAAAQLKHPGIVSVHEVGRDEDTIYIVSDLVRGASLSEWAAAAPPTVRASVELCAKVADALHHAHEAGVVHRDIKPSNIMIDLDGEPHIMDFGLARRDVGEVTVTVEGQMIGTPAFMSPEQARGEAHQADRRSDVYSLGVILYQLLTGELPFRGQTRMLVVQILRDDPPKPRTLNSRIPRDLQTIALKCLEKVPARRYTTAADLAADLRRFLRGEPIHARPLGPLARTWRWCRRNPWKAAACTLALLVVVLSLAHAMKQQADSLNLRHTLAQEYLHKGQTLSEHGNPTHGLHWFARSLRTAPANDTALREVIRQNLVAWSGRINLPLGLLDFERRYSFIVPSPDAAGVATVDSDGTVQLWSGFTGQAPSVVMRHEEPVNSVNFSPDSRLIITGSGKAARVLHAGTGLVAAPPLLHDSQISYVGFCADGRQVLTVCGGESGNVARFWSAGSWKTPGAPIRFGAADHVIALNPDGSRLLTGSPDGTATLWSAETGEMVRAFRGHNGAVNGGAFSPDGRRILTGSVDDTARLWDAETGKELAMLQHQNDVVVVAFSPEGKRIATGGRDSTARLWEAETGAPVGPAMQHGRDVRAAVFSPDGKYLLTSAWEQAALWSAETGESLGPPMRQKDGIFGIAFSPDARAVLLCEKFRCVLWSTMTESPPVQKLASGSDHVRGVSFSPDGRLAVTGADSGSVLQWSVETGQRIEPPFQVTGDFLWAVVFSPDGRTIAVGGVHGATLFPAGARDTPGRVLPHKDGSVRAIAFSRPDGQALATGSFGGTARIWSTATGAELVPALEHPGIVEDVAFSDDGQTLVTACNDGAIRFWSVQTGKPTISPIWHKDAVLAVAFSSEGRLIASGSRDHTARFWHAATGEPTGMVLEHAAWVEDVCFTSDGRHLLTASQDGTVRFWSIETGEQVSPPLVHDRGLMEVAISPDGTRILVGMEGAARLWTIPAQASFTELSRADTLVPVLTMMEMDEKGSLNWLTASAWRSREQQQSVGAFGKSVVPGMDRR